MWKPPERQTRLPLWWLKGWHVGAACEYVLAGLLVVVPFGFDKPSSLGLDFDHQMIAVALLVFVTLGAIVTAAYEKSWVGLLVTAGLPLAFGSALFWWE